MLAPSLDDLYAGFNDYDPILDSKVSKRKNKPNKYFPTKSCKTITILLKGSTIR